MYWVLWRIYDAPLKDRLTIKMLLGLTFFIYAHFWYSLKLKFTNIKKLKKICTLSQCHEKMFQCICFHGFVKKSFLWISSEILPCISSEISSCNFSEIPLGETPEILPSFFLENLQCFRIFFMKYLRKPSTDFRHFALFIFFRKSRDQYFHRNLFHGCPKIIYQWTDKKWLPCSLKKMFLGILPKKI